MVWLRLTDFWGRKKMILAGYFAHIAIQLIYLITMTPLSIYILLFFFGFKSSLNCSIAYLLLLENVGPQYRATAWVLLGLVDGSSNLWLPLLFKLG